MSWEPIPWWEALNITFSAITLFLEVVALFFFTGKGREEKGNQGAMLFSMTFLTLVVLGLLLLGLNRLQLLSLNHNWSGKPVHLSPLLNFTIMSTIPTGTITIGFLVARSISVLKIKRPSGIFILIAIPTLVIVTLLFFLLIQDILVFQIAHNNILR